MKIVFWPDGCWCNEDEIQQMTHKSDDFAVLTVPDDCEDWEIDAAVRDIIAS